MENPVKAPGLTITTPPCSLCGTDTDTDGEVFSCGDCGFTWSMNDPEKPGEPIDPDEPICGNTVQPHLTSRHDLPDGMRTRTYRCVLRKEHHEPLCIGVDDTGGYDFIWATERR